MRQYGLLPDYRHEAYLQNDFIGSVISGASVIGEQYWSAAGTLTNLAAVAGHPGIIEISTGASSGTVAYIVAGPNGIQPILPTDIFDTTFIVRLNTNDSDTQVRVGLSRTGSGDPASDGVYIEKLYTDTSWFGVTRAGSLQTRSAALASASTNWLTARMRRVNSSTVGFTLDGGTEVTATLTIPTTQQIAPFVQIKNQVASAKTIDVDYYEVRITGLSRT